MIENLLLSWLLFCILLSAVFNLSYVIGTMDVKKPFVYQVIVVLPLLMFGPFSSALIMLDEYKRYNRLK